MNTKGIQQVTKRFGGAIAKNSPTILTWLAVSGLITTAILSVKATPKALLILEEEQERREEERIDCQAVESEPITTKETVALTWKCYIPAAIMGVVSIGCIIGSNSINMRRNAALAGAYSLTEKALKEYQSKVVETIGDTKERKIREQISRDKMIKTPLSQSTIIETGRGDTLCFDPYSDRYFRSDIEYIRQVLNDLSRDMMTNMMVSLNEVYYALDLKGTKLGQYFGWRIEDGNLKENFSSQLTDNNIPCLVLDYDIEPSYMDWD